MWTLLQKLSRQKLLKPFRLKIVIFATGVGVVDTGGEPWAASIFANFRKKSNS